MMITAKPLNQWLKLLDNTKLPVLRAHKLRVRNALSSPQTSLSEIAGAIGCSPSIALIFMREAGKQRCSTDNHIPHLEAALKLLGMTQCQQLLERLDESDEQQIPLQLRQLWLISQHASAQASALFAPKLARLSQEIHCSSLLYLAPLWPLITRHPELFTLWEKHVLSHSAFSANIERQVLGTSLADLCQALAEHWCLPEWVLDAYRTLTQRRNLLVRTLKLSKLHQQPLLLQQQMDANRDIYLWFRNPANTVILANGLAIKSQYSWTHEHCLRWQRFIALFLDIPLDQVQQKTHINAVEHARHLGRTDLWHPAQSLLWPHCQQRTRRPPNHQSAHVTITGQTQPLTAEQYAAWQQQALLMLQRPSPFDSHDELLEAVARLLTTQQLTRIAMLAVDSKSRQLRPIFQKNFTFALHRSLPQTQHPELLQRLLKPSTLLHVRKENLQQIQYHLGKDFILGIDSENFLLGSICWQAQPLMLIVADADNQLLHEQTVKAFKASCRYSEQALAILRQQT